MPRGAGQSSPTAVTLAGEICCGGAGDPTGVICAYTLGGPPSHRRANFRSGTEEVEGLESAKLLPSICGVIPFQ